MSRKSLVSNILLLSAVLVSSAVAVPIQLTVSGAIQFSNMGAFPVGQQATVSLVYESSTPYQSLQQQQAFFVNAITSLTFTSGAYSGTDNTDPFGVINKYNDLQPWFATQPWDGISFAAFSNAGNYTFTTGANTLSLPSVISNAVSQTFEGVRINFEADHPTVWNDWSLPLTLDYSEFNATHNMLFGFSGGSFQVGISSVQAQVLQTGGGGGNNNVPDTTATFGLLLVGLGTLRRFRAKRATR